MTPSGACDSLPAVMADKDKSWRNVGGSRRKIISYVKSPLGFYTLALLIVESFLFAAGAFFNFSEAMRTFILFVGVMLFVGLIATVTTLVVKFPQFLVFSEESHLEWESMHVYGDSVRPLPEKIITVEGTGPLTKPPQPQIDKSNSGDT